MLFERQVARKPDLYPWTRDFRKAMWNGFWTAEKFTFDADVFDFNNNMTEAERQVVTRTLAGIAQVEVAVKKFWSRLGDNLPHPSISGLGTVMAGVEEIHNDAYEKLLGKLGLDDVFEQNLDVPAIGGRVGYLNKHNDKVYGSDRKQYVYSLILFTLFVENVSLFSQFFILLWLNRFDNKLKDTAQQVKYTRNEELLHGQAGTKIINTLRQEYPELFDAELEAKILEETHVALRVEYDLIDWMLQGFEKMGHDERGNERPLNAQVLKSYIADRFNESLVGIGYPAQFVVDPDDLAKTFWMTEGLLAPAKVDFFHGEPTGYSHNSTDDDDF